MAGNKINIQDIIDEVSAKERFSFLDGDRNSVLERARNCAKLTIPSILPDSGHTETTDLDTPYQAVGSRLVNNLSAKLLLSLLPPNNSFFRLLISEDIKNQIEAQDAANNQQQQQPGFLQQTPTNTGMLSQVEAQLVKVEQQVLKQIEREALRVPTFEAIKSLIVTGNSMCYKTEVGLKTYKLSNYVILRDFKGQPIEIILKETTTKDTLTPELLNQLGEDVTDRNTIDIYTRAVFKNDVWYEYQTVEEVLVEGSETTYSNDKNFPYIPLRWTGVNGENYGRGLVEQYLGDFRSLEALYQMLLEASAVQARVIFGKRPGGQVDLDALNDAENGACIQGDLEQDITTLRVDKNSDLQIPMNMVQDLTRRLEQAFLVASSVARDSERTTATEIRYMAADLEEALGGVYSLLSLEYQRPLANILLSQSKINLKQLGLDVVIVTGIDALGRNNDLERLRQFNMFLKELGSPELVLQRLNIDNYISMIGNALGLETNSLVKTTTQIQNEQAAQQQQQLMMQGASGAVDAGVQQLMPQQQQQQPQA